MGVKDSIEVHHPDSIESISISACGDKLPMYVARSLAKASPSERKRVQDEIALRAQTDPRLKCLMFELELPL